MNYWQQLEAQTIALNRHRMEMAEQLLGLLDGTLNTELGINPTDADHRDVYRLACLDFIDALGVEAAYELGVKLEVITPVSVEEAV